MPKWLVNGYIYIYGAKRFRSVPVSYFTRCMMQMLLCRRISHSMTPVCRSWIQETAWRSPSWQKLRRSPSHHSFNTKSCSNYLDDLGIPPPKKPTQGVRSQSSHPRKRDMWENRFGNHTHTIHVKIIMQHLATRMSDSAGLYCVAN